MRWMHTKLVMELINPPEACSNMAACFLEQSKKSQTECIVGLYLTIECKINHVSAKILSHK